VRGRHRVHPREIERCRESRANLSEPLAAGRTD
jgi:hypothetical protein